VFELSDEIIFVDIYAARELDTGEVSSEKLAKETKKYNKNAMYAKSFEVAATLALEKATAKDIIVVMGAGDVNEIVDILLGK
jgi:UDP-N-acetylmuramate--alanine ligase